MNDPYKPPESDIEIQEVTHKTKWKIFFWIILVLEAISILIIATDPSEPASDLVLELTVYVAILIGLFGFAYGKCLFSRLVWKIILPVGVTYDIYALVGADWLFGSTQEMYIGIGIFAIIIFPLMFLQYMALYKYGFKSPEIWE